MWSHVQLIRRREEPSRITTVFEAFNFNLLRFIQIHDLRNADAQPVDSYIDVLDVTMIVYL